MRSGAWRLAGLLLAGPTAVLVTMLSATACEVAGTASPAAAPTAAAVTSTAPAPDTRAPHGARNEPGPEVTATASEDGLPAPVRVPCPRATVTVSTSDELTAALDAVRPGQVIELVDGTYSGNFTARTPGTAREPIFLCGGRGAVLDGGTTDTGYVVHVDGAAHWRLVGFTVQQGKKGVMVDSSSHVVVQDLAVRSIGDEGVHLRRNTTDSLVIGNDISATGLEHPVYGEGVYVGSAVSNWCEYTGCTADRSDRNTIADNTIRDTGAESIDVKEGTTRGLVVGNSFDGRGTRTVDSWLDICGTAWVVRDNHGVHPPYDGLQQHRLVPRWGERNIFAGNVIEGPAGPRGKGHERPYGIALTPVGGSVVRCDNRVVGGDQDLSNVPCTP